MMTDDALQAYVQETLEELQIPGAAIGIQQGEDSFTQGFGITHIEHPLQATGDTLFQIGSVTKTFTGTAAMLLVEDGLLNLDEPIQTYLPDFVLSDAETAQRVTMRHLLTHVGGWVGDYFNDFGDGDDALQKYVAALADLPQHTPLGKVWSYNNSAFCTAGRVIEVISGQAYEAFIEDRIFKPLGMDKTFFFERDVMLHRFAVGHFVGDEGPQVAHPWPIPRASSAAGRIISTVEDMLKYARFHLGLLQDDAPVLPMQSIHKMQEMLVNGDGFATGMGLSWFLDDLDGVRIVHHGGATNGQLAMFFLVPEQDFGAVILTNGSDVGRRFIKRVQRWILEKYVKVTTPDPIPLENQPENLAEYAGTYTAQLSDVSLSVQAGVLILQPIQKGGFPKPDSPPPPQQPPPMEIRFDDTDRFYIAEEGPMKFAKGQFVRDDNGAILGVRVSFRVHIRQS